MLSLNWEIGCKITPFSGIVKSPLQKVIIDLYGKSTIGFYNLLETL